MKRVAKRDDKLSKYDFAADDRRLYESHAECVEKGGSWWRPQRLEPCSRRSGLDTASL